MAHQFVLRHEITVEAALKLCFLLSTSVEIVECELGMHPVRGRTSGLVRDRDTILWQGWQLGLPQFHESLIEDYRPYVFFRDRMTAGRFRTFSHDHSFHLKPDGSVCMRDELRFTMRWGWLGNAIGALILMPHIRRLMRRRFSLLKRIAESEDWRRFIPASTVAES